MITSWSRRDVELVNRLFRKALWVTDVIIGKEEVMVLMNNPDKSGWPRCLIKV